MKRSFYFALCVGFAGAHLAPAQTGAEVGAVAAETELVERVSSAPATWSLTDAQRQTLLEHQEAMRAASDRVVDNHPASPPGRPLVRDPQTTARETDEANLMSGPLSPDSFVLGKSVINPNLSLKGQTQIVEPSISNVGLYAIYLSNDRADFTSDGGTSFTQIAIPAGPADAPAFCCDQTIVYDRSHSMWLWSRLYTDGGNNGVVQLSVIKNAPTIECTFTLDPGGAANNLKPDYPQLGLGDNKLYLSTSEFVNGSWLRDRMYRFTLDDLAACPASLTANVVGFLGQAKRVWTPVRGAREIMYWGQFENSTQLRIWSWPESSSSASSVIKTVQATNFVNSDCRGGNNNKDWIESEGWGSEKGLCAVRWPVEASDRRIRSARASSSIGTAAATLRIPKLMYDRPYSNYRASPCWLNRTSTMTSSAMATRTCTRMRAEILA